MVGIGQAKQGNSQHFQSVFDGRKGLLTLGLLECLPCEQTTQSRATWHVKGCREKCPRRHYSCLGALRQTVSYVNLGSTLFIRRLFSIQQRFSQWSVRYFRVVFSSCFYQNIRLQASFLPILCSPHNPSVFQEMPFSLNYADQHFLLLLSFSLFLHIILWYITYLHLAT